MSRCRRPWLQASLLPLSRPWMASVPHGAMAGVCGLVLLLAALPSTAAAGVKVKEKEQATESEATQIVRQTPGMAAVVDAEGLAAKTAALRSSGAKLAAAYMAPTTALHLSKKEKQLDAAETWANLLLEVARWSAEQGDPEPELVGTHAKIEAEAWLGLSDCAGLRGDYQKALDLLGKADKADQQARAGAGGGKTEMDKVFTSRDFSSYLNERYADLYEKLGDREQAARYRLKGGQGDLADGSPLANLGACLSFGAEAERQGNLDLAMRYYLRGEDEIPRLTDTVVPLAETVELRRRLGLMNVLLGFYRGAAHYLGEALSIDRQKKDVGGQAGDEQLLSLLARKQQKWDEATDHILRAVGLLSGTKPVRGGPLPPMERFGDWTKAVPVLEGLSELALEQGRGSGGKAEKKALAAALAPAELAVEMVEQTRSLLRGEASRSGLLQAQGDVYLQAVDVLVRLHRLDPTGGFGVQAFGYLERLRARAFLDLLARSTLKRLQGVDKAGLDEEERLIQALAQAEEAYWTRLKAAAPQDELERLFAQRGTLRGQLDALRQKLSQQNPRYASIYAPVPDARKLAGELLDGKTVLLSYSLLGERGRLFVVGKTSLDVVELDATPEQLASKVEALRTALLEKGAGAAAGEELSRLLLEPAARWLKRANRVIVVPDGPLHGVPFAALPLPRSLGGKQGATLVDRLTVVTAPSASLLLALQQRGGKGKKTSKAAQTLVAFGDPDYSSSAPAGAEGASRGFTLKGRFEEKGFSFPPLPNTRKEVEQIAGLFPGRARTYLGAEASEQKVKAEQLGQATYLHFASHGVLGGEVSGVLQPALVLSLAVPGAEDGFLQMSEVMGLELDAELVTLSACNTGRGRLAGGEGVVGLSRAFLYAGSRAVVVSLWSVADESTALLMGRFYKGLAEGHKAAQALREAQLWLRDQARGVAGQSFANPFFWAPFVVIGG